MPAIMVTWGAGRQGLHMVNERGETEFQGEAAGGGDISVVLEGLSKEVTGGAPPNQAQHE